MRILEVSVSGTVGTQNMGPVSTDVCELSNHFSDRGHEVILADLRCTTQRHLLRAGVRLMELNGRPESWADKSTRSRLLSTWRRWSNYYRVVRQLAAAIDLKTMDVIHVHAPEVAFLLQRCYGLKVFYTAHTSLWSMSPDSGATAPARRKRFARLRALNGKFHVWVERDAIKRSRLTIGVGDYLRLAMPYADIMTIPNGLYLDEWKMIDREEARQSLALDSHQFILLFVGRICPEKGVDLLLEAVRLLAPALPNLQVFIIGPLSGSFDTQDKHTDPYAQSMMELARDLPVRFLGFINNREQQFKQYLSAADAMLVPSRVEPQGKVVMEAMVLGTPVIGSRIGGIPDMVTPETGYLFPRGDANALAACIRAAHDNPEQHRNMRLLARKRIEQHFTWDSVADRHLAEFTRRLDGDIRLSPKQLPVQ